MPGVKYSQNAHGTVDTITNEIANIQVKVYFIVFKNTSNAPLTSNGVTIPGHSIFTNVYVWSDTGMAKALIRKRIPDVEQLKTI